MYDIKPFTSITFGSVAVFAKPQLQTFNCVLHFELLQDIQPPVEGSAMKSHKIGSEQVLIEPPMDHMFALRI